MTFVKLTDTNGKPLLLKYELIESVKTFVYKVRFPLDEIYEMGKYETVIKLTNGNEYTVKKKG